MAARRAGAGDAGGAGKRSRRLCPTLARQRGQHEQVPYYHEARKPLQQRTYQATNEMEWHFRIIKLDCGPIRIETKLLFRMQKSPNAATDCGNGNLLDWKLVLTAVCVVRGEFPLLQ